MTVRPAVFVIASILIAVPVFAAPEAPPQRKALFVSVLESPFALESRQEARRLIARAERERANTLFVQVYRANRAWFESAVADDSPYRECRRGMGEDPLAYLIREAHAAGIEVHAWMNLLSLSANENAPMLRQYGPSILTRNREPKRRLGDYKIDNQYFLEPGDPRVRRTLLKAVEELLAAYPELDGLQLDYIRYPDTRPAYGHTATNSRRFLAATGAAGIREEDPKWRNWKRAQVTDLVRAIGQKAKALKPDIAFSTTGLMPYARANLESFQDWRAWLKHDLVDFVTLMCYTRDEARFGRYLKDARRRLGSLDRANIAVGAYMLKEEPEVFVRQWTACEKANPRACVVL